MAEVGHHLTPSATTTSGAFCSAGSKAAGRPAVKGRLPPSTLVTGREMLLRVIQGHLSGMMEHGPHSRVLVQMKCRFSDNSDE